VFIPIEKMLLFRTEQNKGSPEGRSLLRNVYRSWYYLKRIQELEAVGIQKDATGMLMVTVPMTLFEAKFSTANDPDTAKKRTAMKHWEELTSQVMRNEREGLVFPPELDRDGKPTGYSGKLMSTGGSRSFDTDAIIKRYQKEIGINFSTTFQQLGVETTGSQALSSDLTSMFALSNGAILATAQAVVNRFGVQELMELNGCPPELRPQLIAGDIEREDAARFSDALSKLILAGAVTTDPGLEDFTRKKMGYPPRDEDDSIEPDDGIEPAIEQEPPEPAPGATQGPPQGQAMGQAPQQGVPAIPQQQGAQGPQQSMKPG
jgi:hypothetical protein